MQQPVKVSDDLQEIVGDKELTRAQVTSGVWDYIKKHDLQDDKDRRQINPDAKLGKVIGKGSDLDVQDDRGGQQAPVLTRLS